MRSYQLSAVTFKQTLMHDFAAAEYCRSQEGGNRFGM